MTRRTNLPIYYPARAMFSPDVMAVLDVATHPRPSWVVSKEGKGLDFAVEVLVLGNRSKDIVGEVQSTGMVCEIDETDASAKLQLRERRGDDLSR
jgi:hypothetical protein